MEDDLPPILSVNECEIVAQRSLPTLDGLTERLLLSNIFKHSQRTDSSEDELLTF